MTDTPNPNASAAGQDEYDILLNHEYDGIREYDNPLPPWWVWLWAASAVFSLAYVAWYHGGDGASIETKYVASVERAVERQVAMLGDIAGDDATILRLMKDDDMMAAAAGIFRGNCAQCHGNEGGGNIGPNLCDEAFKNVTRPEDIYTVINAGIEGTSMPAWGQRMSEPQLILVSAYVASIRGSTPSPSIAPDGKEIPAWSTFESAESAVAEPADADPTG